MPATNAHEPAAIYGDVNEIKNQLVNRIMRMDEPDDLNLILDFVKKNTRQKDEFEQEWEQGMTIEDFRMKCKLKLKEMYDCN